MSVFKQLFTFFKACCSIALVYVCKQNFYGLKRFITLDPFIEKYIDLKNVSLNFITLSMSTGAKGMLVKLKLELRSSLKGEPISLKGLTW